MRWLISAPLLQPIRARRLAAWTVYDLTAVVPSVIGFLFEAIGDWQLTRFRADPDNRGTVLLLKVSGVGLLEQKWKRTRPEYAEYIAATNAFLPWCPRTPRD